MSGAAEAAASNRLTMFSVFNSLDGVTLGGGGTAGFSWDRERNAEMKSCRKPNECIVKGLNLNSAFCLWILHKELM